jgi:hypothetical protein
MYADRVYVFHRADRDGVILCVAHDLELYFLPPRYRLLDKHLADRGHAYAVPGYLAQLFRVVADAAAGPAERESGADDEREAYFIGKLVGGFKVCHDPRGDDRLPDFDHRILEKLPVFSLVYRHRVCAQELHALLFKEPGLRELHGERQPCLPTERRKQAVRLFFSDYPFKDGDRQRFDVYLVSHLVIGHYSRGV